MNINTPKRLCWTFLARHTERHYSLPDTYWIIECDNSFDQRIYDNVRNELYTIIYEARKLVDFAEMEYNIDGITISDPTHREVIEKYFNDQGLFLRSRRNENIQTTNISCQVVSKITRMVIFFVTNLNQA